MTIDWLARWQNGHIGWHRKEVNWRLKKYLPQLDLKPGDEVLLPLAGKSVDILYLSQQGFKVIAIELSQIAVEAFFSENGLKPTIRVCGQFTLYQTSNIRFYLGDIFDITAQMVQNTAAIYDRAALIALDKPKRKAYIDMLVRVVPKSTKWLLLILDYPQQQKSPPPFAVSDEEVSMLFAHRHQIKILHCVDDLVNDKKFLAAGVDFLYKITYLITLKQEIPSVAENAGNC